MKIIGKILIFALILAGLYLIFLFLSPKSEVQAPVIGQPTGEPIMTPPLKPPPQY